MSASPVRPPQPPRPSAPEPAPEFEDLPEPPQLRGLRRLVTALIVVLILGVITVAATLVIRLGQVEGSRAPVPPAPIAAERLSLPEGETALALGRSAGELLVWTRDEAGRERLRSFSAETGAVRSVTLIERQP